MNENYVHTRLLLGDLGFQQAVIYKQMWLQMREREV